MEMREVEKLEATAVVVQAVAADGGTRHIEAFVGDQGGFFFYVDGRIGSPTSGELYFGSPHVEASIMLPPDSPMSRSVKRLFAQQAAGPGGGGNAPPDL
jgi:hypothetical protein